MLCNAGLALRYKNSVLFVDVPNGEIAPFFALDEETWQKIIAGECPYENIAGFYFTHNHPDHYHAGRLAAYLEKHPDARVFLPDEECEDGVITMGEFKIEYHRMPHAPLPEETPPHVISKIYAGDKVVYIAGDAELNADGHAAFIGEKQVDAAFWNSMYLSRPDTRVLLQKAAKKNYIYHMPGNEPDVFGLWKKCRTNFRRYGEELENVTVMDRYPYTVEV